MPLFSLVLPLPPRRNTQLSSLSLSLYIYIYTSLSLCIYIYIHNIYIYTYIHIYICTSLSLSLSLSLSDIYIYIYIHTYISKSTQLFGDGQIPNRYDTAQTYLLFYSYLSVIYELTCTIYQGSKGCLINGGFNCYSFALCNFKRLFGKLLEGCLIRRPPVGNPPLGSSRTRENP